jgi:hypothetical protein
MYVISRNLAKRFQTGTKSAGADLRLNVVRWRTADADMIAATLAAGATARGAASAAVARETPTRMARKEDTRMAVPA